DDARAHAAQRRELFRLHQLHLVFLELLEARFERLAALVQLITEGKFAETELVVKIAADDHKHARHKQEIDIVKKDAPDWDWDWAVQETGGEIQSHNFQKDDHAIQQGPTENDCCP